MTLYERIRQLRIKAGMSQDDLAKSMGYSDRSMITKIESGKVDISQKKILAFARILNTTPGFLMGIDDYDDALSELHPHPEKHNDEVRTIAQDLSKLTPEQLKQAKAVLRAMFAVTNPDLFK